MHKQTTFDVPGAFEMPLKAQQLAKTGNYDAIICAAFVVDGGIYRHDFVAAAVVDGLMRVGLDTGVPVLSVSLTPHHYQETDHHNEIYRAHFVEKGREAARAALSMRARLNPNRHATPAVDHPSTLPPDGAHGRARLRQRSHHQQCVAHHQGHG